MVERSLSSLPRFLSESLLGGRSKSSGTSPDHADPCAGVSRGLEIFIQNVNKSTSKHYERQVVERELTTLRQRISQPGTTTGQTCDHLCRAIYCHMLGYDVSFAYIHAVTLAQRGTTLLEKRLGYLATSLLLQTDDELILLLINTIQRDLRSSNLVDNCMALTAASQLVGADLIPSLLPLVLDKLRHQRELVRQKAVLCLYRFQLLAPDLLQHVRDDLDTSLHDKDPGVMAAAVNIIQNNIQKDPGSNLPVADSLMSILHQIISRHMSSMFEYHSVPFPWLQIQILRCLGDLGAEHTQLGAKLSPLLLEVLQRSSTKDNISYAILYECIRCITRVKSVDRSLLDEAAKHVRRFVRSAEPNFKFIGVKALTALVEVDSQFAVDYQGLIVESLDTADHTLQRKMYVLLYKIANTSNVQAICAKLLLQLETSMDKYWRSEVVTMVIDLAHRLPKTVQWKYETIFHCLQLAQECVQMDAVHNIITELNQDIADNGTSLEQYLVKTSVEYLMRDNTSHRLVHVLAWCLGELAPLLQNVQNDRVISLYMKRLSNPDVPSEVKACLVTGLQKLLSRGAVENEAVARLLQESLCVEQQHPVIKQRLQLLYYLASAKVPATSTSRDDEMDFTLSFIDSFISDRLESGALPFRPPHLRHQPTREENIAQAGLYDSGQRGTESLVTSVTSGSRLRSGSSTSSGRPRDESESMLNLSGVKRVWRKEGRLKTTSQYTVEGRRNSDVARAQANVEASAENRSDQKMSVMDEDEKKKRDLTSALFAGIQAPLKMPLDSWDIDSQSSQSGQSGRSNSSGQSGGQSRVSEGKRGQSRLNEGHTVLPGSDDTGWRSLHRQHEQQQQNQQQHHHRQQQHEQQQESQQQQHRQHQHQQQQHQQESSLRAHGEHASVTDVHETTTTSLYNAEHQESLSTALTDVSIAYKTAEPSHLNTRQNTIPDGDSSIETYMTCNSSVNLKSPVSAYEPIEDVTGASFSLYTEHVDFTPDIQHDRFEFESTNRNACDIITNQSQSNSESSNRESLISESTNQSAMQNLIIKDDSLHKSGSDDDDLENTNLLSLSVKSSLHSTQNSNSEYFKGDNSAYVNISLCSNDSSKVSVSEVCVNNNVRSRQTQMALSRTKADPDHFHLMPGPDVIAQSKGDKQNSIYGTVSDYNTDIDYTTQTNIPDSNNDTQYDIVETEHAVARDFVPNIYNEELGECANHDNQIYHSTPRVTEGVTHTADQMNEPAGAGVNLQPTNLYSEELDICFSGNHGNSSLFTDENG